jgi:uncharacterized OB-fold protein
MATPPQPLPDPDTAAFWQATGEGHLAVCRCQSCGLWMQPPLDACRACAGPTAFEDVAGTGSVYSFIVQRQAAIPGYLDVPYAVGVIQLDEQPRLRLPGRIVGIDPGEITCDMRVKAELVPLPGGDFTVAVWRPVAVR